jgi:Cd2+/Zn2+-exporting ATPase
MQKVQLDLPILLPELLDEQDNCIRLLLNDLNGKKGIIKAHIKESQPLQLCVHYEPALMSLAKVEEIARKSGAEVTQRYQHTLVRVKKVRHQRHARQLEHELTAIPGVITAMVSVPGTLRLEWDSEQINEQQLREKVRQLGLSISPATKPQHRPSPQQTTHNHEPGDDHDHSNTNFLGEHTELYFAIGSGIAWLSGFLLSFIDGVAPGLPIGIFTIGILLGGYFTLIEAFGAMRQGKFEIDFLMLVAAIGAAALGKWGEAALLLFLFSMGHALEHYAMNRARKSISALADLAPPIALVKRDGKTVDIPIEDLKIGDVIVVKPNSKIAADGIVIKGSSSVNQAPITGESVPVDKHPIAHQEGDFVLEEVPAEHRAFAGTINGSSVLEIKVLRATHDSTLARLITLVKEAETQKSPTQLFADKFERYYVPVVLGVVVLLLFAFLVIDETFSDSFYRAMAVLIAASPCALAISTPSAVLAGVARAARQGVLIKGGRPLEDLGNLTAVAFDKTGTLTEGKPHLTHAIPYENDQRENLLMTAAAVEALSDHPLAKAIVNGAKKELGDTAFPVAEQLEALTARGVKALIGTETVHIGNRRLLEEITGAPVPTALDQQMKALEDGGHTAMIIHRGDHYLGIIAVMDTARPEAKATLAALRKIGIRRMIMLTGDHQQVAEAVAAEIGITDPLGSLLPEDKVAAIERLKAEEGKVAMVGDGVNDAPAMAKSTVGIAMGAAGSDVALETADIALMADKLDNLPFAIALSRKAKQIIKQNLVISLGMVAILVPLTIMGVAEIGPAVVAHEGSTLVVVLNALRLLGFNSK